ncbi:glycoside hydrolase family 32 protein [Arthrobacter sp. GMC3]|uniref:glycoside hydrolase family 32 protein n=1 Tax=Arthrobacter sp. GMC3 TaxID=2058894 RepID=UPI000CE3B9C0|nr:glycoside hydrolase family 32 protein [Arthrobacter sp. GMC3]
MPSHNYVMPRPTFHFTPQRNWINDPNGLVHHGGLWHLFYQYNPEGPDWGNMSWGHATSTDLQHWSEHPVALPYSDGEQIYSGSIVATQGEPQLTAFYTSAFSNGRQAQSKATSIDGGFTWEQDPHNPVLDRGTNAFRDPKVIRYADADGTDRWVLLAVEAEDRQVLFYSSTDLSNWEYRSSFGPLGPEQDAGQLVWECPDLIPLPVDGDPENLRWVLLISTNAVGEDPDPEGSSMSYLIGDFDGTSFTTESTGLTRLDHGRDFYAGVTFDNAPANEKIMLGWMSNWAYAGDIPSAPWRGAMSLPRRLSLRTIDGFPRLLQRPPEFILEQIAAVPAGRFELAQAAEVVLSGHSLLELHWDPAATGRLSLKLQGDSDASVDIEHSPDTGALRITRHGAAVEAIHAAFPSTSTIAMDAAPVQLLLSLDGPLLELFINDGEATASNLIVLGAGAVTARLDSDLPGCVTVTTFDVPASDNLSALSSARSATTLV